MYLGYRPVVAASFSNLSIHKIAMFPHIHHSSRLKSDLVMKHKKDLHTRHGVGEDIFEIGEYGRSFVEDEVNEEGEALEDTFALSGEGMKHDQWGDVMESIIQVCSFSISCMMKESLKLGLPLFCTFNN